MAHVSADEIRDFMLARFEPALITKGFGAKDIPDDFDLFTEGVIDSLGILEMITAIEERYSLKIDFEELDPDDFTRIGPLCRFIENKSGSGMGQ